MREPTNAELADGRPWCIAGGWAACPQLATDQDVWIFHDVGDDEDFVQCLNDQRYQMLNKWDAIDPIEAYSDTTGYELGVGIIKVGTIGSRHILLTDASDIKHLLSCFDISTHQCAIDEDMNFITGTGWTPVGVTPNILRIGGEQTAVRLAKITSRYRLA